MYLVLSAFTSRLETKSEIKKISSDLYRGISDFKMGYQF